MRHLHNEEKFDFQVKVYLKLFVDACVPTWPCISLQSVPHFFFLSISRSKLHVQELSAVLEKYLVLIASSEPLRRPADSRLPACESLNGSGHFSPALKCLLDRQKSLSCTSSVFQTSIIHVPSVCSGRIGGLAQSSALPFSNLSLFTSRSVPLGA